MEPGEPVRRAGSAQAPSSHGIMKTTTRTTIKPAQTRSPGVRALSTEINAARSDKTDR